MKLPPIELEVLLLLAQKKKGWTQLRRTFHIMAAKVLIRKKLVTSLTQRELIDKTPPSRLYLLTGHRLTKTGRELANEYLPVKPVRRRVVSAESAGFDLGGFKYFLKLSCGHTKDTGHHNMFQPPKTTKCETCTRERASHDRVRRKQR